jgi:hypothetical protein
MITQPLISIAALERSLSRERLQAYRLSTDRDETDGLARYIWNAALGSALAPALQTLEVAFRNEINRAAAKLTAGRVHAHAAIPSWLDARPTMLLPHECDKVERAKQQLGSSRRSQTEGHLVAKLDFGFWVALCREPYADSRANGPRLWPRALNLSFRHRPATVTTRGEIHRQFDRIRRFRNRVAHHEPIWDRDYPGEHEHILESLRWMSPKLADTVRQVSPAARIFADGPEAYRPYAEAILGTGPGIALPAEFRVRAISLAHHEIVIPAAEGASAGDGAAA